MWNIQCTKFFRKYTYNRLRQLFNNQFLCVLLVFMTNAVWHGFYPGNWVCPPILALHIGVSKCLYRYWNNKLRNSVYITDEEVTFISGVIQCTCINLDFIIVDLREWYKIQMYMESIYWTPVFVPLALMFFFKITGYG